MGGGKAGGAKFSAQEAHVVLYMQHLGQSGKMMHWHLIQKTKAERAAEKKAQVEGE